MFADRHNCLDTISYHNVTGWRTDSAKPIACNYTLFHFIRKYIGGPNAVYCDAKISPSYFLDDFADHVLFWKFWQFLVRWYPN